MYYKRTRREDVFYGSSLRQNNQHIIESLLYIYVSISGKGCQGKLFRRVAAPPLLKIKIFFGGNDGNDVVNDGK
jgi:hypothetical protein